MLTFREIEQLSSVDRIVAAASHAYYQALLRGASSTKLQRLRQVWVCALQHRWPDLIETGLCDRCFYRKDAFCSIRRQRDQMIAEAAYYRAVERSFCNGNPEQDWLEAERAIDIGFIGSSSKQTNVHGRY